MELEQLVQTEVKLYHLLNSPRCNSWLEDEYKELFAANHKYHRLVQEHLFNNYDPNTFNTFHDMYIMDLSERREINDKRVKFVVDSMVYKDGCEIGYYKNCSFNILTSKSMRELNKKEIFNLYIEPEEKILTILYHHHWSTGRGLTYGRFPYIDLQFTIGEFVE